MVMIMTKTKLPLLLFLLFSVFFLSLTSSSVLAKYEPNSRDPQTQSGGDLYNANSRQEYMQCLQRCQQQGGGSERQKQCQKRCKEIREDEQQQQCIGGTGDLYNADSQEQYEQCLRRCQQQGGSERQRRQCIERCEELLEEQKEEQEIGEDHEQGYDNPPSTDQEEKNPYHFTKEHFKTPMKSSEGHFSVLEKFSKRSELLKGIEDYRFGIFEMNPSTFTVPHHVNADELMFVAKGIGSISMLRENKKETYNVKQGDVIRVLAGSVVYMINRDNTEKIVVAKLILPGISTTPGQFEVFFAGGGEDQESFYGSIRKDLLEAAFNTPWERLNRTLIGQQKKGAFIKASQEQIKALTPQTHGGGDEPGGPINLLNQRPVHSNSYGQHFLVTEKEYKKLRDMDIAVSFFNISRGAMVGPYYDTRSTKVCTVVDGSGYYEMECPYVSSSDSFASGGGSVQHPEGSNSGQCKKKVTAKVSRGDVVVVVAGYPTVVVSSRGQNFQALCFEINARDNEMNSLAGKLNVLKDMEREAKELAFGTAARNIETVINAQQESFFYPGPQQQQEQARAYA